MIYPFNAHTSLSDSGRHKLTLQLPQVTDKVIIFGMSIHSSQVTDCLTQSGAGEHSQLHVDPSANIHVIRLSYRDCLSGETVAHAVVIRHTSLLKLAQRRRIRPKKLKWEAWGPQNTWFLSAFEEPTSAWL